MPEQRPKEVLIRHGTLNIQTDATTFEVLRSAVVEHAGIGRELAESETIRSIVIFNVDAAAERPIERWLRDQVALIGCALVASALLFTLFIGVISILGWFLQ